jgi:MOSC domain-containing protein YiiM
VTGKIEAIFVAESKKSKINSVTLAQLEAGRGIIGDRYHTLANQHAEKNINILQNHITLVEKENLDTFLRDHKSHLDYGQFRRNILTSGIDLNALVGKEFTIGTARCHGIELCEPCRSLSHIAHNAVLPGLVDKGGLRAIILNDGTLAIGSDIKE